MLLAILLPALLASQAWPFAVLTMVAMAIAGWEWARLNGAGALAVPLGVALAAACVLALYAGWATTAPRLAWWLAFAIWVLGGTWVLRAGVAGWPRAPRPACAGRSASSRSGRRGSPSPTRRRSASISSSRSSSWSGAPTCSPISAAAPSGKRKLAPAISPGKSWEGVWSGMAGALLVAAAWLAIDAAGVARHGKLLFDAGQPLRPRRLALIVVFLVAMSVVGDLFESLVKRSAGAKDSSKLLPGHGGILDRVDGLLPVFPIALALVML